MKKNNKGFTLAELLIVVAIIAVLTAIAIPVFTGQLEKSREATDLSNIRAAYAEASAALLTGDDSTTNGVTYTAAAGTNVAQATKDVTLNQTQADWQTDKSTKIAEKTLTDLGFTPSGTKGQVVTVTVKEDGTWTLAAKA